MSNPKVKYLLEVIANLRSKYNIDQKITFIAGINNELASLKAAHQKQERCRAKVLLRLRTIKIAIQRGVADEVINGDQQKYPLPEVREAVVGLLLQTSPEYQKLTQEHVDTSRRAAEIARDIENQKNRRDVAIEQIHCYQAEMGLAASLSGESPPQGLEPPEAVSEPWVVLDGIDVELGILETCGLAVETIEADHGGGDTRVAGVLQQSVDRIKTLVEKIRECPTTAEVKRPLDDDPPE